MRTNQGFARRGEVIMKKYSLKKVVDIIDDSMALSLLFTVSVIIVFGMLLGTVLWNAQRRDRMLRECIWKADNPYCAKILNEALKD